MSDEIQFPVEWQYRITALADADNVRDDLIRVLRMHGSDGMPEKANVSKTGKYISWKVDVTFHCRADMESLSRALGEVSGVKFVL